jgi:MFS family permease
MDNVATSHTTAAVPAGSIPNKRWFHILVPVMILCIISYMDRTNISFAMAGGMSKELAMSASFSGFAAGIFFIGYLFLQVPAGQLASRGIAKKFLTWSMVAWGVLCIVTTFIQNETQLVILRFILGVAEGGMLPVALTIISNWFPDHERGRATAIMIMFVPIANIISGPIAGMLVQHLGWRQLFMFEGIATFILILPWVLMVEEDPRRAKWLDREERDYIVNSIAAEQSTVAARQQTRQTSVLSLLANVSMWKLIIINFFYQCAIFAFVIWLPTVLKTLTKSDMTNVGLLSTLPYVGTIIGMYTIGRLSDKSGKRRKYVIIPLIGFALALLLSVVFENQPWVSFSFLVFAGAFLQAAAAVFWTILPQLFSTEVSGGARGVINALGNLGGFLGPFLVGFLSDMFGGTRQGILALVAFLIISAIITATLPKEKPAA